MLTFRGCAAGLVAIRHCRCANNDTNGLTFLWKSLKGTAVRVRVVLCVPLAAHATGSILARQILVHRAARQDVHGIPVL